MQCLDDLMAPDRLAAAVDSLCAGSTSAVLVHAEQDPTPGWTRPPIALFCTPLPELVDLGDVTYVLGAVEVPPGWQMAGLCVPTKIRFPVSDSKTGRRVDAWFTHVVTLNGSTASRLCVPDAPELSGPTTQVASDHELTRGLTRCLTRLIRPRPR